MIELHDVTCSSNVNDLISCAQWFSNNIGMLKKYQKYILINIANEWVRTFFRKIKKYLLTYTLNLSLMSM